MNRPAPGLFAREALPGGDYPGSGRVKEMVREACRSAYQEIPRAWRSESTEPGVMWYQSPSQGDWGFAAKRAGMCYLLSR